MSEELAWAAGLFDGEGCTCVSRNRQYKYVRLSMSQAGREVLDRFQSAVGIGGISGPLHRGQYKPYWVWNASGISNVETVIGLLWPWLSTPKREQASAALEVARSQKHLRVFRKVA